MDPFESIKQTFFQECDELLTDAEQGLLAMETGDADDETINAVFRAVEYAQSGIIADVEAHIDVMKVEKNG